MRNLQRGVRVGVGLMAEVAAKIEHGRRNLVLPDWRDYLTPDERVALEAIENRAAKLDRGRARLTDRISAYRNRCIRRREKALAREAIERRALA